MSDGIHLQLILGAALLVVASPGPATLAIAGTSMQAGRRMGLALASGVVTGSVMWSTAAACGFSALLLANAWVIEAIRYAGACYLLYLAFRSGRSALTARQIRPEGIASSTFGGTYLRGVALHLTNPKPVLFFGSLFAFAVRASASAGDLATIVAAIAVQTAVIVHFYALLFSSPAVVRGYLKARRWFDAAFALAFGAAGLKILTAKLQT